MSPQIDIKEVPLEAYEPLSDASSFPLFTQSDTYGQWHMRLGGDVCCFEVMRNGVCVSRFLVVCHELPFGFKTLSVPYGPFITDPEILERPDLFGEIRHFFIDVLKEKKAAFVRIQPSLPQRNKIPVKEVARQITSVKRGSDQSGCFQPDRVWFVDMDISPDDLFSSFSSNTRSTIRRAERKGVFVDVTDRPADNISTFLSLLNETARRKNFALHTEEYYRVAFSVSQQHSRALGAIAYINDEPVSAGFVLLYGGVAHFLFSGSSDRGRAWKASYLLRWKLMKEACVRGCLRANFGAVTLSDSGEWSGFSRFKQSFGGYLVEYSSFDIVRSESQYALYKAKQALKQVM